MIIKKSPTVGVTVEDLRSCAINTTVNRYIIAQLRDNVKEVMLCYV